METAILKKDVQRLLIDRDQYDMRAAQGGSDREEMLGWVRSLKSQVEDRQATYLKKRLELARLKRQIARESKALDQPVREKADLTEMTQRLGALEKKVEKILQLLSTKE